MKSIPRNTMLSPIVRIGFSVLKGVFMRQFQSKRAFGLVLFSLLSAASAVFGASTAFSLLLDLTPTVKSSYDPKILR
jgi:hypothetical protein